MDEMASTTTEIRRSISINNLPTYNQSQQSQVKNLTDFASAKDKVLMTAGILFGFIYGSKFILLPWIMGSLVNTLSVISMDKNYSCIMSLENNVYAPRSALDGFHTYSNFQQTYGLNISVATIVVAEINRVIPIYVVLLIVSISCHFGMSVTLQQSAFNQVQRIKLNFVHSLLQQDISWFDNSQPSKLISQTENDLDIYQDCIGLKLGLLFSYVSSFVIGFLYCLILQWRVALVGYSTSLLSLLTYKFSSMVQKRYTVKETNSYSEAGIVAEDVLTAFKTVISYNGQSNEIQNIVEINWDTQIAFIYSGSRISLAVSAVIKYTNILIQGQNAGIVKSGLMATAHALLSFFFLCSLTMMSWYATYLYQNIKGYSLQENSVANLITVFMIIGVSYQSLGESFSLVNYIFLAKICGKRLLEIINKIPSYDRNTNNVNIPMVKTIDKIEFIDVEFSYSSRKDINVLHHFNLQISKGEKVALIGNSGSGKSTVISLLHRFYDPTKGSIRINGYDIKELNLGWLRSQIGVVGQEPVLFPMTIYENIRYGYPDATKEDIEMAAKMANAHTFIIDLPLKYDTIVGDRGTQLSGGQKQQIAIARALIRMPPILLLDEATSALDSHNEQIVQQALNEASIGCTCIIIAHRLSTIQNADKIVVMSDGEIVESGNHDSLMKANGVYCRQAKVQERQNEDHRIPNAEEIGHDGFKEAKIENVNNKLVNKTEFPRNSKKVTRWRLSCIQNMLFFRLLTIGGCGPVFMCLGMIASIAQGLGIFLIFVYVMPSWYYIFNQHDPSMTTNRFHTLLFNIVLCAIVLVISTFLMILLLGMSGALIAKRLRSKLFFSMMRQEVSWYDQSKASVGNLCLIVSHDIENVKMAINTHLGIVITAIAQTVSGLIIIFIMSWIYGCLSLIFYIIAIAFPIYTKQKTHRSLLKMAELSKFSSEILREVVMNIRTIRFLGAEDEFRMLYLQNSSFSQIKHRKIYNTHITFMEAIVDSIAPLANFFNVLVTPTLFLQNHIVFIQFLRTYGVAVMTSIIGRALAVIPNISSALVSLEKIITIIDEKPQMENISGEGKILTSELPGTLLFDDVSFSYPTRSKCTALNRFHIDVDNRQIVAIVGSSGSGKSTCVQLAARFYDPQSGYVFVCDELVRCLQLHSLRQMIGIVHQEPIVFNRSISENIAYGDLSRDITTEEIVEAAKMANAHDFICLLPQGYETVVGHRGTQISGGQKQRIAIARALIKKPKILFLDEATSALDSETDKKVQQAIKSSKNLSTVIIIAHRLSTITDADQIFVIHQGMLVEKGKHNELMDLNGFYTKLYQNQINK